MRKIILAATTAAGIMSGVTAAHAQMAVIDHAQLAEWGTQLQQGASQLSQLQQQLTAQLNMIKNLPGTVAPGVVDLARQTQSLMSQINGLQGSGSGLLGQLNSLYPSSFSSTDPQAILNQIASMQTSTKQAYTNAQALQAQAVANQAQLQNQVSTASTYSQSAVGQLQATQATNQILVALTQQLGDMQATQSAQANAVNQQAMEQASELAAAKQENALAAHTATAATTSSNGSTGP